MSDDEDKAVEDGVTETEAVATAPSEVKEATPSAVLEQRNFEETPEDPAQSPVERLQVVLDIPVQLSMELGRTRMSIRELMQLNRGSVVKLDQPAGEPLDILVNGCLVARGEVVVVNERYGVRITEIVSPAERISKL